MADREVNISRVIESIKGRPCSFMREEKRLKGKIVNAVPLAGDNRSAPELVVSVQGLSGAVVQVYLFKDKVKIY